MLTSRHIHPIIFWVLGFLFCIAVAVYIRVYPWRVGLSSDVHEKASLLAVYQIKQSFANDLHRQHPAAPPAQVDYMATQQLNELMHRNPQKVMAFIDQTSQQLARETKASSPTYLLESDPFYYYNLSSRIAATGTLSPDIKHSKYLNHLMNSPQGAWQPYTIHPFIGYGVYQILHPFFPHLNLMAATAIVPLIISVLTIMLFALIAYLLRFSLLASLAGAFILSLAPIYLKRSALGWYDTDPYNVFFTLLLGGFMMLGLRALNVRRALYYGIAYGVGLCLYALIWQGWVMMFIVGIGCCVAVLGYGWLTRQSIQWQQACLTFIGSSVITAVISISACFGIGDFFALFSEGIGELGKFTVKGLDIWPNLFIGVGELKRTTLSDFIKALGGPWVFILLLISTVTLLKTRIWRFKPFLTIDTIIIGALLIASCVLSFGAERFILFTLIPIALLITIFIDSLLGPRWVKPALCTVIILLNTFFANSVIASTVSPIFNSTWEKSLVDLKLNTPPSTIVNTWWPPGHFIKAISERGVLFDGATLSEGAMGFWFARALLTSDETKAQGIFRMINTSRNEAVDYLIHQGLPASAAVQLIEQLAPLTTDAIQQKLSPHLKAEQAQQLMTLLRGQTPSSVLLLYNELMDTNLILSFTGNWDISKVETINKNPQLLANVPKRGSKEFIDFVWSIAGGQTKTSPPFELINETASTYEFTNNLTIQKVTLTATIDSPTYGRGQPRSVIYADTTSVKEQNNPGANLNYSIVLYKENDQVKARLMDTSLANSLFVKLYLFDGVGLHYFKPINTFSDLSRRTVIKTFQIKWND